jgi:phosphoglycolate phosphatase
MIKAVIFDLDGTLLDTIQDIANTGNRILEKRSYEPLPVEIYKQYVGKGVKHLLHKLIEHYMIPKHMFDDMLKEYYIFYKEESVKTTKVYDGIDQALLQMKEMGLSLSVLSNKPHEQVLDLMPKYFHEGVFVKTYGKHGGIKAKPDPTLLRKLIRELKVKKTEVLYVGDTRTDMETALNAGVQSVGVLWGFRDETELVQAKASYIVSKPQEMVQIIQSKNKQK